MEHLLIFGASTCAAARSAIRAGYRPWCADLFADRDLRRLCPVQKISGADYPRGFVEIARHAPAGPWMYTGGLENHASVVAEITKHRRLLGTRADVLKAIRSPFTLAACLRGADLPAPLALKAPHRPPLDRVWLVKPFKGTGGRGIVFWQKQRLKRSVHYFQEFIEGEPVSAVFVAHKGTATFFGATRQLVGQPWLHAAKFHYCGSVGPLAGLDDVFQRIGMALTRDFELEGVFGIDCVVRDEMPYVVEVNPRYTASVEVLERSCAVPVLGIGVQAKPMRKAGEFFGKAVLYAKPPLIFPEDGPWEDETIQTFADIPDRGQLIAKGRPILTIFASGPSIAACEKNLRKQAAVVDGILYGSKR